MPGLPFQDRKPLLFSAPVASIKNGRGLSSRARYLSA
jgi:hypothetical protein